MNGLPEIPKVKHSLLETAPKSTSPPFFEDSGLELRGGSSLSRPSTASSALGIVVKSPSGSAGFSPSPPPGGLTRPRSSLSSSGRRAIDYVRVSKGEMERTEEITKTLRTEAVQMQAQIRNLQRYQHEFTTLQNGCGLIAGCLGCSVEGVEASAIKDILLTRITGVLETHQQTTQQVGKCNLELEQCRGELAAANVRLSGTETQLKKSRKEEKHLKSNLKQSAEEVEMLRQTCARTGATVESLRQQLAEVQGKVGKGEKEASLELTQLQTNLGRSMKELTEKDDRVKGLESQLTLMEKEQEILKERLTESEAMHVELCVQLATTLQVDSTVSMDVDHLLSQVSGVVRECEELRLHSETLSSSIKTAELDSKASRETILRLVAEGKEQHRLREEVKRLGGEVERLQCEVEEQKVSLLASESERVGLQERLTASKETTVALEHEVEAKETRLAEMCRHVEANKAVSDSNKSLTNSVQSKYDELVDGLAAVLAVESSDSDILMRAVQEKTQKCLMQSHQLEQQESLLSEREALVQSLQSSSVQAEEDLRKERARLKKLRGELSAVEVVREGLAQDLDKSRQFCRKVARAVRLESGMAEILSSGDFAHDAILMKAEQLAKLESEMLLNKQTAVYSLQRKLKASRQTLQSKELHMGLLQRKVEGLEQRLKATVHKETEWEATVSKMKKMEKQLERLQEQLRQQRDTVSQLESDSSQLQKVKECCRQLEVERAKLLSGMEELEQSCGKHSRELAEAKRKAKLRETHENRETNTLRTELKTLHAEQERLKDREEKLLVFRTAVQRLLLSYWKEASSENKEDVPSDYDLIASLEELVGSQKRQQDNARCLEASLKQLELGFKTSYKDTLTLLSSS